jgi:hypothetical protein
MRLFDSYHSSQPSSFGLVTSFVSLPDKGETTFRRTFCVLGNVKVGISDPPYVPELTKLSVYSPGVLLTCLDIEYSAVVNDYMTRESNTLSGSRTSFSICYYY